MKTHTRACTNKFLLRARAQGGFMKWILVFGAASFLSACAHETTTMDRELALKLADREPVVIASAPPTININVNGGAVSTASADQENHNGCRSFPVYSARTGQIYKYEEHCYGGGE